MNYESLKGGTHLYLHNVSFKANVNYLTAIDLKILNNSSEPITTWTRIAEYIINVCNGSINCCGAASGYTAIWFRCIKSGSYYNVYVLSSTSIATSVGGSDQEYLKVQYSPTFDSSDCTNIKDVVVQNL